MDELDATRGREHHPEGLPDQGASNASHTVSAPRRSLAPAGIVAAGVGLGLEGIVALFGAIRLLGDATLQEETLGLAGIRLLNREAPAAGALFVFAVIAVATIFGLLSRSRAWWVVALVLQALIAVDALIRLPSEPLLAAFALLLAAVVTLPLLGSATRAALGRPAS